MSATQQIQHVDVKTSKDGHRRIVANGRQLIVVGDGTNITGRNWLTLWDCYAQTHANPWRGKFMGTIAGDKKAEQWLS